MARRYRGGVCRSGSRLSGSRRTESGGASCPATWASLLIGVDDEIVTCVVDERARTVRNHIYVPLYVLAEWLVTNWWFLFHEVETPAKEDNPAFARRHALGVSREGYAFPNLQVAPAGARIRLVWTPDRLDSAKIEFLRKGKKWIESNEFRDCCSDFVDRVIRRLIAFGVEGTLLQEEWAAIQAAGADESKFCGVAAGLGWDPYALNDAERAAVLRLDDVLDEAVLEEAVAVLDADDLDTDLAAMVEALETGKAASLSLERLRALRTTIPPLAGGSRGMPAIPWRRICADTWILMAIRLPPWPPWAARSVKIPMRSKMSLSQDTSSLPRSWTG